MDEKDIEEIKIGLTNQDSVINILGYPSLRSYFDDNTWYYYSYKSFEFLFFKPFITKQKLLVIEFDSDTLIVKNKSLYNINSNKFEIKDINSDYKEERENIIKDIFNNIGQVSM